MPRVIFPPGSGGGGGGSADTVLKTFVADATIVAGEPIRLVTTLDAPTYTTPGRIVPALGNVTTFLDDAIVIGVAVDGGVAGEDIQVLLFGTGTLLFDQAPTTAQLGQPIFLSATVRGRATMTVPTEATGVTYVTLGILETADGGLSQLVNFDPEVGINIPVA